MISVDASILCVNIPFFFFKIDLQQVAQRIEDLNPPEDVFRSVAENAVQLSGIESDSRDFLDVLCSQEDLAKVSIQIF